MLIRHLVSRRFTAVVTQLLSKQVSVARLQAEAASWPGSSPATPAWSALGCCRGFAATVLEEPARDGTAAGAALTKDDARSILQARPFEASELRGLYQQSA